MYLQVKKILVFKEDAANFRWIRGNCLHLKSRHCSSVAQTAPPSSLPRSSLLLITECDMTDVWKSTHHSPRPAWLIWFHCRSITSSRLPPLPITHCSTSSPAVAPVPELDQRLVSLRPERVSLILLPFIPLTRRSVRTQFESEVTLMCYWCLASLCLKPPSVITCPISTVPLAKCYHFRANSYPASC